MKDKKKSPEWPITSWPFKNWVCTHEILIKFVSDRIWELCSRLSPQSSRGVLSRSFQGQTRNVAAGHPRSDLQKEILNSRRKTAKRRVRAWRTLEEGDEGLQYLPNCQTNFIIVLSELAIGIVLAFYQHNSLLLELLSETSAILR